VLYFLIMGMMKGAVFALAGWGFSIILGILGIVNFNHGIFFVLGGYLTAALFALGLPPWLSILCGSVLVGIYAVGVQRLLISRVMSQSHMMVLVLTLGVAIVSREVMGFFFGHDERFLVVSGISDRTFSFFGYIFPALDVIMLLVSVSVFFLFYYLFNHTAAGLTLRIIGENTEIAKILGLDVEGSYDLAMFFCGLWTAMAGSFTVFILPIGLHQDAYWTIMSFLVVIMGGAGNLFGTFISALIVGAILFISSIYVSGYSDAVIYLLLLIILLCKPTGLFKSKMMVEKRI